MTNRKEWFSVQELKGMPGMPGMPGTMRGVLLRVRKGSYKARKRAYGKGMEYAFGSLPAMTQAYLKDVAAADEKARGVNKQQAVAPVNSAQAAIDTVASEGLAMSEMDVFRNWLLTRKKTALALMNSTTGYEFARHCADFSQLAEASMVVHTFEQANRG